MQILPGTHLPAAIIRALGNGGKGVVYSRVFLPSINHQCFV